MPRLLIIKLVMLVLKGMLPALQKAATASANPLDDLLVQMVATIIEAFDSGELPELMKEL